MQLDASRGWREKPAGASLLIAYHAILCEHETSDAWSSALGSHTISLGLLIGQAHGGHPAAWLHPHTKASGSTDIDYFRGLAQTAEKGLFDLFFVADTPAARTDNLHAWSR